MKINKYEDISEIDREAKKDFIDRHSAFIHCENQATKGEKVNVNVKIGDQYQHPDDPDHFISWIQLWSGEKMLAQANFTEGAQGNIPGNLEVDFYIVPQKDLKLMAHAFCTKHGLWQSDEKLIKVGE